MMTPEILYQIKESAGKSFQPSNGTEGMIFEEAFCQRCIHDHAPSEKYCETITGAMCFSPGEEGYPNEWVYNEDGWPVCTKWKKWDWGNDGDPDDPDNPKAPPIEDPDQLMLFSVADDILENHKIEKSLTT